MTYIVPEITLATRGDIIGILDLQEQNLLGRGGLLSVRLPGAFIEAALDDLPQIVARRDGKIVAYLLAGSRSVHAQTPIIKAMFRAYSGSHDAYIYGPICVAESERGHGLATAPATTPKKERLRCFGSGPGKEVGPIHGERTEPRPDKRRGRAPAASSKDMLVRMSVPVPRSPLNPKNGTAKA